MAEISVVQVEKQMNLFKTIRVTISSLYILIHDGSYWHQFECHCLTAGLFHLLSKEILRM